MQTTKPQAHSSSDIVILPDRSALAREAVTRFAALAREAIKARGRFAVALSGGATPRDMYTLLATQDLLSQIDWSRVHVFWGDERLVPPDSADSNYRMANDAFLAHVPIPTENVHRIRTELPPEEAARDYEQTLREFFAASPQRVNGTGRIGVETKDDFPSFDLILLGLGANGHTASLFPHTRVLHETQRWVVAAYIDEAKMWRITFSTPVINAAKDILWLVSGADKASTVHDVLRGEHRPDDLPAQLIKPTHGNAVWLLDKAAASKLQIGG